MEELEPEGIPNDARNDGSSLSTKAYYLKRLASYLHATPKAGYTPEHITTLLNELAKRLIDMDNKMRSYDAWLKQNPTNPAALKHTIRKQRHELKRLNKDNERLNRIVRVYGLLDQPKKCSGCPANIYHASWAKQESYCTRCSAEHEKEKKDD